MTTVKNNDESDMRWTRVALLAVCPVHVVMGAIGLVMVWPFGFNYIACAAAAACAEVVGQGSAKLFRSRPDPMHQRLSMMLWITAALTHPFAEIKVYDQEIYGLLLAVAIAAGWRVAPRDMRPLLAAAVVVLLVCFVAHLFDASLGDVHTMEVTYMLLYGATAVPLTVFTVERTIHTFLERRR